MTRGDALVNGDCVCVRWRCLCCWTCHPNVHPLPSPTLAHTISRCVVPVFDQCCMAVPPRSNLVLYSLVPLHPLLAAASFTIVVEGACVTRRTAASGVNLEESLASTGSGRPHTEFRSDGAAALPTAPASAAGSAVAAAVVAVAVAGDGDGAGLTTPAVAALATRSGSRGGVTSESAVDVAVTAQSTAVTTGSRDDTAGGRTSSVQVETAADSSPTKFRNAAGTGVRLGVDGCFPSACDSACDDVVMG